MKIIAAAAGKGGTGKSCVTAYTGLALATSGKNVLIIELGRDSRSIDIILGVPDTALFTLQDALSGACEFSQAVYPCASSERLSLLPCSPSAFNPSLGEKDFDTILAGLTRDYDYIMLDGADFAVFPAGRVDTVLNVTTPEWLSIRAAAALTKNLPGAGEVRLVINKVPPRVMPIKGLDDFDDVVNLTGARLIAVIPESPKLRFASNNTAKVDGDSIIPKIFDALAARLEGRDVPLLIK